MNKKNEKNIVLTQIILMLDIGLGCQALDSLMRKTLGNTNVEEH
jgi:hypothetical protein